ncbi:MAG: Ig-like domain-containing protein [Chloroflexi bacterium]|nr:Ig-like domain-containing protein [Chloroflexota bacterium]
MSSTKIARPIIILAFVALLLLCICAVLFQFTEIDTPVTSTLRGVVPSGVKDALRPLRAPQVLTFAPEFNGKDIAPTSPITISFLTPMSANDNAIQISPDIRGTWKWNGATAVFTPAELWPLSTTVNVTVTREARSWLMRRAEKDFAWSFNVIAPTGIVSTAPRQGAQFAYLRDRLTITFNREMDRKSVEERLKVEPAISNMSLLWEGNQLIIGGNLKPSTAYKFFLPSGAKDNKYGLAIPTDFAWSFTTTQQYPYLAIINIGRYGLTTADKPTTLKLQSVNVSKVDVALHKFDTDTYIKSLAFSYDKWRNFKPDSAPLKTWTITAPGKVDQYVTQDLQLDALPAGTYYLTVKSAEGVNDTQVLVSTKTALTLKRTTDQVLVWATSITDGSPVQRLLLTFYNSKGETVGTGATDKDGLYEGTIKLTKDSLYVVGVREGDVAAVSDQWEQGIEPWRFENVQYQWNPMKHTYRVYVYTDRPLYRPGQTVYFKAIVRSDDDGAYTQPPAGTQVQIKVGDWQERVLYDKTLKTSDFGSIADSFTINPEAGLGTYQIVAKIGDEEYSNDIQVEEYRKPEYSVSVSVDRKDYVSGDTITATIRANYFFGGAVTGSKVHWTLYANDYYFYWSGGDLDFGEVSGQRYYGYGKEISSGDATLNANGELVLKLPADISQEKRSQVYTIEATVTDESNQPQSAIAATLVHRGNFYIGMKPSNYIGTKGTPARFDIQTLDTNGKPVGKVAVSYTLNLINWNCYTKKDDKGRNIWKCDEVKTEIQRGDWTTDANGKYQLQFTPPKGGSYRLDAEGKDARGNRVLGQTWMWVSDRSQFLSWAYENNDRIGLVLDKKQYKVGDVAKVLIQSPYEKATALVTLERGKIISRQLIALDSNSATVDVPITDSYFPNVYVGVILIPQGGFADGIPSFKMGLVNLPIMSDAKALNVSVASNKTQYLPRDKASYSIKTLDASGKPVSAEVSLSVVDKAVLALASNFGADITQGFYGKRDLAVNTAQSLTVFLARVNQREDFGGGGGGGEEPRKSFPDIAYWNPTIVTDSSGNAKVDVTLPDNLTTWTAIANGVTASTQVGKAQSDTIVTKDLIVRPVLPRFMNVGDAVTLGAIVRNSTDKTQTVIVSLNATNLSVNTPSGPTNIAACTAAITTTNCLSLASVLTRTVTISAGQSATVNWNVTVPSTAQLIASYTPSATVPLSTTITLSARGSGVSDAVQLSIPIEPYGEKQVVANAGQVESAESKFAVTVPKEASFATFKLTSSPSLAAGLIDSLQYLTGYPYGCVEQTMSRFLPDVLVKQTLDKLKIKNDKLEKELPKQVEDSLTRLYNFQHGDGGWGWWENDDSIPYETAYVLYGLAQAKKAGYPVDENVIKRAMQYLKQPLVDTTDYNLKVYIAYALTEAGQGDAALARSMIDKQNRMSLNSRAMLALMLKSLGEDASAKSIVADLEKLVIETGQHAHWEEVQADLNRWEYYSSNGRTTATVLRAVLALDPQSALVQKTVRYMMVNRLGGYWRTTQETAQTIIALTDYLAQSGELTANYTYNIFVDGKDYGKQSVSPSNVSQQQTLSLRLDPGTHEIRIVKSGEGRLYFASTLQYYTGSGEAIGAKTSLNGPVIRREYVDPKTEKALTSFKVGDLVRVKITLDMPREGWYMMVTDPLPAGFEAINYSLNTSGIEPTSKSGYRSYWSRPDLRDDRAVFFTTYMWKGKHTYTYLIRATSSGTFRALPAEVAPMYEPDVFGRSASTEFAVK